MSSSDEYEQLKSQALAFILSKLPAYVDAVDVADYLGISYREAFALTDELIAEGKIGH